MAKRKRLIPQKKEFQKKSLKKRNPYKKEFKKEGSK
ncbi:hypothetical protein N407_02130 [Helicobacter pylori FD662]|nr:hypothetical protein N407_02130 [Helicobacter pylori FD662]